MAKIVVVGMGQGGMVSAIKLAGAGHDVCVFERCQKGSVSYEWKDDIRADIFSLTDIPMPDESVYCQKSKWLFVSPNEEFDLAVPPLPPMEEISISRQGLSAHLADLLEKAGGRVCYGKSVDTLVVKDDKIVGVVVDGEECLCDLVIDASGMRSPLRAQVPNKFEIQAQPTDDGVMYGYRAFFKQVPGTTTRAEGINSTLVLKHLGGVGISWCNLNEEGEVDVLIGRVGSLSDLQIEEALNALRASNPILSQECLRERRVEICLRNSIARAVADGYVAIGDSAFMTMPLMGSGIESSMKAGKLFADYVVKNNVTTFDAVNTWPFYAEYMRTLGADFIFVDLLKRWALALDPKRVDWVFGGGLIEKEDLALVSTDNSDTKPKMSAKSIVKKVFLLLGHFPLVCSALSCVIKCLKAKSIAKKVPAVYDEKKLSKWTKKYNKLTCKK